MAMLPYTLSCFTEFQLASAASPARWSEESCPAGETLVRLVTGCCQRQLLIGTGIGRFWPKAAYAGASLIQSSVVKNATNSSKGRGRAGQVAPYKGMYDAPFLSVSS